MHPWIQTQLPRLEVELKLRLGSCQGGKSDSKEKAAFHREIRRNPLQTQQSILETPVEHQIMNLSGTPNCSNSRFVVFVDGKFLTPPNFHCIFQAPFSRSLVQTTHLPSPAASGRISSLGEVVIDDDCIHWAKRPITWPRNRAKRMEKQGRDHKEESNHGLLCIHIHNHIQFFPIIFDNIWPSPSFSLWNTFRFQMSPIRLIFRSDPSTPAPQALFWVHPLAPRDSGKGQAAWQAAGHLPVENLHLGHWWNWWNWWKCWHKGRPQHGTLWF